MNRRIHLTAALLLLASPAWSATSNTGQPVSNAPSPDVISLRGPGPAILYAPSNTDDATYRADIATAAGATVDYIDASASTPDLITLQNYDCVYTWANAAYDDAGTFGDNLADYVDGGGTVVLGVFTVPSAVNSLAGRILTAPYSPVSGNANAFTTSAYAGDGTAYPHVGVSAYGAMFRDILALQGAGIQDGSYADGEIAQAFRPDGRVVYSNGVGTSAQSGTGDWPQLVANACLGASLDLTVTKLTDTNDGVCDADCSLREAVILANTSPYPDTINLGTGIHTLSIAGTGESAAATGDLDITDDLVIQGAAAGTRGGDGTMIDAQGIDRVFSVDLAQSGGVEAIFRDLTITGGITDGLDGGFGAGFGAGAVVVGNGSSIALERVMLLDNEASISGGGLIAALGASVRIEDSTLRGNSAAGGGGAMQLESTGSTITGSTISGNTETGLFSSRDQGSSILAPIGTRGSTSGGGGIRLTASGSVTITNSTLSGNESIGDLGDAIENQGSVTIESSTIARPRSAPDLLAGLGTYTLSNSIVDGSCEQAVTSLGGNLEAPGNTCDFEDPPRGATALRMRLAPLALNGGHTATHGPAEGSPAIDGGLLGNCEPADQRGVLRPLEGDDVPPAGCDVGAVEYDPLADDFTTIFTGDFDSGDTGAWGNTVP